MCLADWGRNGQERLHMERLSLQSAVHIPQVDCQSMGCAVERLFSAEGLALQMLSGLDELGTVRVHQKALYL